MYVNLLFLKGLQAYQINKSNQVVQVINEKTGEIIYTLRIKGTEFRPKVFANGTYTINVGEGDARKSLKGIESQKEAKTLKVNL